MEEKTKKTEDKIVLKLFCEKHFEIKTKGGVSQQADAGEFHR